MQNHTKEMFMYGFATLLVIFIITFTVLLVFYPLPPENKDLVNIALGAFLGAFITVVGYFFGSSKGSTDKNLMFGAISNEPGVSATTTQKTETVIQSETPTK